MAVLQQRVNTLEEIYRSVDRRTWAILVTNLMAMAGIIAVLLKL